jgi:hypothetical protein
LFAEVQVLGAAAAASVGDAAALVVRGHGAAVAAAATGWSVFAGAWVPVTVGAQLARIVLPATTAAPFMKFLLEIGFFSFDSILIAFLLVWFKT